MIFRHSARIVAFLLLAAVVPLRALPQEVAAPAAAPASPAAVYPESAEGLQKLLQDIFAAVKSGDTEKTEQYMASLDLPHPGEWFGKTFGATEGPRLQAKYTELQAQANALLKTRIEAAVREGKTELKVEVYRKPAPPMSPLLQPVAEAMVESAAIYVARNNSGPDDKFLVFLGNFVYVDQAFHNIDGQVFGALSNAKPMRVRMGGNVQRDKLLNKVEPVYPVEARQSNIEGTVVLHVVLGTDGSVQQIQVVSGHPLLVQAALDAVKQWRYQPVLLNGQPVEVDTQINVEFQLR